MAGTYRLGPESGRLLVHTTRTGLGAKAGHDLTIQVTRWHGRATVDTADPANSAVTVEVAVNSFEVREATGGVKPLTDADRTQINKTLKEILHTAQHPTITFRSTRVDGAAGSFALEGELTIRGVTRPVTVQGRVTDGRVAGRASVVQSRWGIRPYSAFVWRPQAQRRGHGRLRRGPHAGRLTALGRRVCVGLEPRHWQFRAVRRRL
jgi:polyisoprenoid-binding protein YceI